VTDTEITESRILRRLRFAFWSLPGWVGGLSLWLENLTKHDYNGPIWRAASQGMFLLLLTPICVIFLLREWFRTPRLSATDHALFVILSAPTLIAVLGVIALFFQTFIGVPMG
jgi:uncharacterized membrane protein required for colicin V production